MKLDAIANFKGPGFKICACPPAFGQFRDDNATRTHLNQTVSYLEAQIGGKPSFGDSWGDRITGAEVSNANSKGTACVCRVSALLGYAKRAEKKSATSLLAIFPLIKPLRNCFS